MSKIASQIRKDFEESQSRKVVSIDEIQVIDDLMSKIKEPITESPELLELLRDADPSYLSYIEMIEHLTVFGQLLLHHQTLQKYAQFITDSEEEYMPEGPPISPITPSFFDFWKLFDVRIDDQESIAQLFVNLGNIFKTPEQIISLVKNCLNCRTGIYKQIGNDDGIIHFKELVTNIELKALCPAGYQGKRGTLWFVRILPPIDDHDYGIIVTTPYILVNTTEKDWLAYFKRQNITPKDPDASEKLHTHMKSEDHPYYWMEFIFDAFSRVNSESNGIYLSGLPDIEASLPHRNDLYSFVDE